MQRILLLVRWAWVLNMALDSATQARAADLSLRLVGGIVHTVSGPTLTNVPVLIRDGRITGVGPTAFGPADLEVDLAGKHL